jgi:outer membrane protein assembly factor BamB
LRSFQRERLIAVIPVLFLTVLAGCRAASGSAVNDAQEPVQATDQPEAGQPALAAVTTKQYDVARTGVNAQESQLTPESVSGGKFHKLFSLPVDDQVETFPLYLAGVDTAGGRKNLVFIATMNNSVYGFDAVTGAQVWTQTLGTPVSGEAFARVKPATVNKRFGVAATPVLDPETGTLYVVRWGFEDGNKPVYRLFVLDVKDGSVKANLKLDGKQENARFDHARQIVRASLLLLHVPRGDGAADKILIIAAAGGEGRHDAHGWVLAYDTNALAAGGEQPPAAAFCTTPHSGAGGVWMAAQGPAAAADGTFFVITGNGPYDGVNDFGESFLRLRFQRQSGNAPASLTRADSFTPFRDVERDNKHQDQDLGSASPMVIPGTNLVIGGGKDGILYVMNQADMGVRDFGKLVQPPFIATYIPQPGFDPVHKLDQATSHDPATPSQADDGKVHHIHSTPVFWASPDIGTLLYVWGENARLRVFPFHGDKFGTEALAFGEALPSKKATGIGGMPGGMLSVSSNGAVPHSGIVWAEHAIDFDANKIICAGIVRAYDADHFKTNPDGSKTIVELWNSEADQGDSLGNGAKFIAPMVANGRLYIPTYDNQVAVYGLR